MLSERIEEFSEKYEELKTALTSGYLKIPVINISDAEYLFRKKDGVLWRKLRFQEQAKNEGIESLEEVQEMFDDLERIVKKRRMHDLYIISKKGRNSHKKLYQRYLDSVHDKNEESYELEELEAKIQAESLKADIVEILCQNRSSMKSKPYNKLNIAENLADYIIEEGIEFKERDEAIEELKEKLKHIAPLFSSDEKFTAGISIIAEFIADSIKNQGLKQYYIKRRIFAAKNPVANRPKENKGDPEFNAQYDAAFDVAFEKEFQKRFGLMFEGNVAFNVGDYQTAVKNAQAALKLNPYYREARELLKNAQAEQERLHDKTDIYSARKSRLERKLKIESLRGAITGMLAENADVLNSFEKYNRFNMAGQLAEYAVDEEYRPDFNESIADLIFNSGPLKQDADPKKFKQQIKRIAGYIIEDILQLEYKHILRIDPAAAKSKLLQESLDMVEKIEKYDNSCSLYSIFFRDELKKRTK